MASSTRTVTMLSSRLSARTVPLASAARSSTTRTLARANVRQQARRGYATGPASGLKSSVGNYATLGAGLTTAGGLGYYHSRKGEKAPVENSAETWKGEKAPVDNSTDTKGSETKSNAAAEKISTKSSKAPEAKFEDYQEVYDAIANRLIEYDEYEDGSYGPVVLRLAWHASGTYDVETGTGGSNGATMRFAPESDHGANGGMHVAREFLEPLKEQFPWISYGDLWTLAGVTAVQEMGGPVVPWRPGREDRDESWCTPDGRLPDGSKGQDHLRTIFGRMGFNDQEIVALSGAHALGRCHEERSGFEGPWTFSPTMLTNDFYKLLVEEKWAYRDWKGPKQYQDVSTKSLMMLPTDMALIKDDEFKKYVEKYAASQEEFFDDFSAVIVKLFELGVPFKTGEDSRFEFKPSE